MEHSNANFSSLFGEVAAMKAELGTFTGQVTENNYTDKAAHFIAEKDRLHAIAIAITKTQRFIKTNLVKANGMDRFVNELQIELQKAQVEGTNFDPLITEFKDIYQNSLVERFADLNQCAIKIKDLYYDLMVDANARMNNAYLSVKSKAENTLA